MTFNAILWPGMHGVPAAARRNQIAICRSLLVFCLSSVQFSLAGESPYTGPGSGTQHFYCSSDPAQPTIFFSSAFDANADTTKVSEAFKQSLADEYAYEGDVLCFGKFKTLDAAQTGERKRVTDLQAAKKAKVVETGWAYGSSVGNSGASAASSPAAPLTNPLTSPAQPSGPPAAQPTAAPAAQNAPALGTTLGVRLAEQ